jgi:hypothetical protein
MGARRAARGKRRGGGDLNWWLRLEVEEKGNRQSWAGKGQVGWALDGPVEIENKNKESRGQTELPRFNGPKMTCAA